MRYVKMKPRIKIAILVILAAVVITISILIVYRVCNNSTSTSTSKGIKYETLNDSIESTEIESETNSNDKKDTDNVSNSNTKFNMTLETLKESWNTFTSRMCIYLAYYSDYSTYDIIIRNTSKESIVQEYSGETAIYKNDGSYIYMNSEDLVFGYNMDALTLIDYAIQAVDNGIASFSAFDVTETNDDFESTTFQFNIDINGIENIEKFYSQLNSEYGKEMADSLRESIKLEDIQDMANSVGEKADDISYRISIICNKDDIIEVSFNSYFGSQKIDNNASDKLFTIWWFNDYYLIPDWELTDDWYTFDFRGNITSENGDTDTILNMCINVLTGVTEIIDEYFSDIGVETNTDSTDSADSADSTDSTDSADSADESNTN